MCQQCDTMPYVKSMYVIGFWIHNASISQKQSWNVWLVSTLFLRDIFIYALCCLISQSIAKLQFQETERLQSPINTLHSPPQHSHNRPITIQCGASQHQQPRAFAANPVCLEREHGSPEDQRGRTDKRAIWGPYWRLFGERARSWQVSVKTARLSNGAVCCSVLVCSLAARCGTGNKMTTSLRPMATSFWLVLLNFCSKLCDRGWLY